MPGGGAEKEQRVHRAVFNEAKVLSRLEHPSLVQVSDFGHAADGTAYLVVEYLRGQSLGSSVSMLCPSVASGYHRWRLRSMCACR